MCPHFQQLTNQNLAEKVHATMVPDNVNCCSVGGDKTKLGVHDIEDLVQFGMQPNIKRGVALYREPNVAKFGLKLKQPGPKSTSPRSLSILHCTEKAFGVGWKCDADTPASG